MPRISADDGESPRKSLNGFSENAVESTAALEQKASVPRFGKRYRETDPVRLPAGSVPAIQRALQTTAGGQHQRRGQRWFGWTCWNPLRRDFAQSEPGQLKRL